MKILIVRSVFVPNKSFIFRNLINIAHTVKYYYLASDETTSFDLLLVGWVHADFSDLFNEQISTLKNINHRISINHHMFSDNIGKFPVYNHMMDYLSQNKFYDVGVYLDHDIELKYQTPDFSLIDNIFKQSDYSIVCFNQIGDVRHQLFADNNIKKINNIDLYWTNHIYSISCGAFLFDPHKFSSLTRFKSTSVYGVDDIFLLDNIVFNRFSVAVLKDFCVFHPFCNNNQHVTNKNKLLHNNIGLLPGV